MESLGKVFRSYIPIVAATKGTLSMIAEAKPIAITITSRLPMVSLIQVAKLVNKWVASKAPMATRIPKKNNTLEVSILERAWAGV